MSKTYNSSNPLELAKQIGYELFGDIGGKSFEELELCYASKLAPQFTDLPKMRPYTNLNLYWGRGYFKSTIMEDFQMCLPTVFATRSVTSATKETMFGSISDSGKALVKPLFNGYQMCFMSELLAFLGLGEGLREKVNVFNEALEGKIITRDLLKFGKAEPGLVQEYQNGKDGLFFDGRTLKYQPNTCFIVGTRPLDNRTYTYLEASGFWSRFHTIQFHVTDAMAKEIFTGSFRTHDTIDIDMFKAELKKFNEDLLTKRESFPHKSPDYDKVMLPVLQEATKIGEKICEENPKMELSTLLHARIKGDITREANAYRILYSGKTDDEIQKWILERLPHFFEFASNPIISEEFTQVKIKNLESAYQKITETVRGQSMKRGAIVDKLQNQGFSKSTVDRALELITAKGLNKTKEFGMYET
jgi:hypothetical protein